MKKVKNISGQELSLIGVGTVQPDEIVEVADDFHNGNFEEVSSEKKDSTPSRARTRDTGKSEVE